MSISQGSAISRFEYVNCKEALKPTLRTDQIIEKDQDTSQTKSWVLLLGRNTPNMQIFYCKYYVIKCWVNVF